MSKILLLGRLAAIVDKLINELTEPRVTIFGATAADDKRAILEEESIDFVVMGGGLDTSNRTSSSPCRRL